MLVRVCLVIAILASLGAAVVSFTKVAPKIQSITSERDGFETQMKTAQENEAKTKKDLKKSGEDLKLAQTKIGALTNDLASATTKAVQQERRANEAASKLEGVTGERDTAQRELSAWRATGMAPDQIQGMVDTLKKTQNERDMISTEKEIFMRNNATLRAKLDLYEDPTKKVVLREGLKGKVVMVDPKWDFVVLDIGSDQGALERGELLVNRDGKLVGKVRLSSVERSRSIANVISEVKQSDIKEGDQVVY